MHRPVHWMGEPARGSLKVAAALVAEGGGRGQGGGSNNTGGDKHTRSSIYDETVDLGGEPLTVLNEVVGRGLHGAVSAGR